MDKMGEPTLLEAIYKTVTRMEVEQIAQGKEQVKQRADIEALKLKSEQSEKKSSAKTGAIYTAIGGIVVGVIMLVIKTVWP